MPKQFQRTVNVIFSHLWKVNLSKYIPKMRWEIVCLVAIVNSVYATSAVDLKNEPMRFLWVATTTTTSTISTSTTCTTSTAALTTCTIGRRRRGLFYEEVQSVLGRQRRGLFYNDEEVENKDSSVFLPSEKTLVKWLLFIFFFFRLTVMSWHCLWRSSADPVAEVVEVPADKSSVTVPLVIESGFAAPDGGPVRFLLSFAQSTVTSYTTTTTTTSLTAFCSSTTGWPLCGNLGK